MQCLMRATRVTGWDNAKKSLTREWKASILFWPSYEDEEGELQGRVAEVVQGHWGPPPKSLDSDESFKPEHTQFCRKLRFVVIYALFGDLCAKKVPFWVQNSVCWARSALLHIYMVYIAYFTELNSKIWDYAQKRRICRENFNYAESLPSPATLSGGRSLAAELFMMVSRCPW